MNTGKYKISAVWSGVSQNWGLLLRIPGFWLVKAVCQGVCLDGVCLEVKVLSPDIFARVRAFLWFISFLSI